MMNYNKKYTTSWWWLKMGFYSFLGSLWISWASKALFREVDKNYNADFTEFKNEFNDIEMFQSRHFIKQQKKSKNILYYLFLKIQIFLLQLHLVIMIFLVKVWILSKIAIQMQKFIL